jgi:thioredoxin 1
MSIRFHLSRLLSRSAPPSRVVPLDGPSLGVALSRRDRDVVVDFWAPRCPACRALAPSIERLADERPDLTVATVDVDRAPRSAERYGIEQLPTVMRFRGGEPVAVAIGGLPYDLLLERLCLGPAIGSRA